MTESEFEDCNKLFETSLKSLSKEKYTYTKKSAECSKAILEEIQKCSKIDVENKGEFVEYIKILHNLFERNVTEI